MYLHRALIPACFLLAGAAAAQVDVVYCNIDSFAGNYTDAIVLWAKTGQRPLAQENTVRGSTGAVQKAKYRVVGSKKYLYWINTFPGAGIWRGTDRNGNGVIDASETQHLFDFGAFFRGGLDEAKGVWAGVAANNTSLKAGVWSLKDLNGDGDFMDAGESKQLVKSPTVKIGLTTYSSDDPRGVAILPNGDFVWHEDDARMWFRTTPTGVSSVYLVYKTPVVVSGPVPAKNPDFGTKLPTPGAFSDLDRSAVDPATGTVYLTMNFRRGETAIYAARDKNNDGDINDTGEVTIFFDGTKATPAFGPIDDIEWHGGAVYGSYEINPASDPGSQFFELRDKNNNGNASDPGELTKLGRTATTDDPFLVGLTVVPAGTFGPSCVNAELENNVTFKSTGGSVTFTVKNIPASLHNDSTFAFLALSFSGDAGLPLAPGCTIGLTPDPFTFALIPLHFGLITGRTLTLPVLNYPAGLPVGTKAWFAGFFPKFTTGAFRGITGTGLMVSN
ncbi:MAG: hypothetical protein ACE5F1_00400 [Planctomycetota bacterium]